MENLSHKNNLLVKIAVFFISLVFVQSVFFKFSNAPETQYIFNTLNIWAGDFFGIEGLFITPGIFNAYVIGTLELIASVFLLMGLFSSLRFLVPLGAFMSLSVISGAIIFHLFTPLGIEVMDDYGMLFIMACGVWAASAFLIYSHKNCFLKVICKGE